MCVRTRGHAILLEDGSEAGNRFLNNLVAFVLPPGNVQQMYGVDTKAEITEARGVRLEMSDADPTAFWITNANNILIGNTVSSVSITHWFAMPKSVLTGTVPGYEADLYLRFAVATATKVWPPGGLKRAFEKDSLVNPRQQTHQNFHFQMRALPATRMEWKNNGNFSVVYINGKR